MPEKSGAGGWRKRIHSRPSAVKPNVDDRGLGEDVAESLRPPSDRSSWRKTIQSRPSTPNRATTPNIFQIDAEEARREITPEVPSPRKATKPKLARYLSGYLSIKDVPKEYEFPDPWSTEMAQPFIEVVDPLVSLQSVYSHMTAIPTRPIPLHYNSGLFRIFEDYRKIREDKERLDSILQETFEGYRAAEEYSADVEAQYQAEIRRLELLIARGTSGMAGLMRARQDTVVKRKRAHRKTISYDHAPTSFEHVPMDQVDEQIRLRTQQVLLQRPVSPSNKMAALSRRFLHTDTANDFTVGTPPSREKKITLSRKVQSELNLTNLAGLSMDNSVPRSLESDFTRNGDRLPDEAEPPSIMVDSTIDLDAFIALQELGALVARKKGLDTKKFLAGLMQLYSMTPKDTERTLDYETGYEEPNDGGVERATDVADATPSTPERTVRHVRSQPQIGSAQRRQRHFSFEPGDDQIADFEEKLRTHGTEATYSLPSSEPGVASDGHLEPPLRSPSLNADIQKPSKIPSPIQRPGLESIRRGSSNSSVQTALRRPCKDERRDSRSSVLTAFRQNSSGSLRPVSQSRSSSVHTLRHGESHRSGSVSSLGVRHNIAAMAAARAVDQADNSVPKNNAATSTAPAIASSARANRLSEKAQMENDSPHARLREDIRIH